ncbi:prolipoprotein diacylglyceryl transferase [Arthrobacter sp. Hiyo8]|nr:prolipoprotein diacylglyceryl transferase [Arthrobacter sp. Hiyo8]
MPSDTLFHPTFLYESLWNIVGVVVLLVLDRRFHFRRGRLFWLYAIYYTLGRVWIEALRIDDAEQINLFGITTRLNVWTSIFVFVAALIIFIALSLRGRPEPDTAYLPGREPSAVTTDEDEPAANSNADEPTAATETDSTIVTDAKAHDTDGSVSDTGAHGNLRNNQSDLGHTAEPTETAEESHAGVTSDSGSASTETTASSAPDPGRKLAAPSSQRYGTGEPGYRPEAPGHSVVAHLAVARQHTEAPRSSLGQGHA